ncbi:TerD family protein [Streptomyces sp. JJ36]|uniref:TerD family protein n=1 Tax=Streptomyces sp. JJ36 TaxID=2736645 RepID=UPI001F39EFF0|nr:TerD family protein [Streptomyces sp. JJ36]MCF6523471.1 TerD family protein [Streptomyces sp. JJ36]
MAREFQRGHKARISDLTAGTDLYVGVQISGPGLSFDIGCFGLDAGEQLSDDRYFVFFNQPKSPEEAVQLLGAQAGDTESFRVTLDRIPAHVQKLSFTAALDGAGQMSQIGPGYLRIVAGGEEVARYPFDGSEFTSERAVMLGDFYLKDVWRFAAVGQGFDGGLEALLRHFGGEVLEEEQPAAPDGGSAVPGFAPPPGPAGPDSTVTPAQPAPGFAPPPGAAPAGQPQQPQAPQQVPPPPQQPAHPAAQQPPAFGAPQAPPPPQAPQPPQQVPPPQPPAPGPRDQASTPTVAAPVPPPPGQQGPPQPVPPPGAPQGVPQQPYGPPQAQPVPPPGAQQPPAPGVPGQAQQPPAPAAPGQSLPNPFGGQAPQAPAVPQSPAAGLGAGLEKYREAPTGQRWTLQNGQLARVDLGVDGQPVLARQGSMVLYQGKVDFGYKGAGFRGRVVGNATGQEMQLMRCSGGGQVFFADNSAHLHPIELQGDALCVSAENVLAFDESLQHEVRRIEGHGIPGGALFTLQFQGTGTVVVKTRGTPVVLPVTPTTFADADAVVAWSAAAQVIVSSQVRLRRQAYPGHSGESVNLQFRAAPGNFVVVQPCEV